MATNTADGTAMSLRALAGRYSPAQQRTIDAALDLFAEHGVSGTSLQMIADATGVTKAAIYHQFPTKEAIVVGVIEAQLQHLEAALEAAEAAGPTPHARDELLVAVIDVVVGNRRALATMQSDPVLFRILGEHEASHGFWLRLFAALLGDNLAPEARVRAAVLSAAIGAVSHPFVIDLDNATVRDELLAVIRPLIFREG